MSLRKKETTNLGCRRKEKEKMNVCTGMFTEWKWEGGIEGKNGEGEMGNAKRNVEMGGKWERGNEGKGRWEGGRPPRTGMYTLILSLIQVYPNWTSGKVVVGGPTSILGQ